MEQQGETRSPVTREGRQRDDPKYAGTYTFCNGFDEPALARRITAFKNHDHPFAFAFHPLLKHAQFDLKLFQRVFIILAGHLFFWLAIEIPGLLL